MSLERGRRRSPMVAALLISGGVFGGGASPLLSAASAATTTGDRHAAEVLSDAVASAAETILPSVVNISATHMEKVDKRFQHPFFIPGMEDMFRRRLDELPDEREARSLGSGFFISDDGYILTNNHVVEDADNILVTTHDEREFAAEIVGTDPSTDVALLKVEPEGKIVPANLGDSSSLRIGELAIAVGNPFSSFAGTVTLGIISANGRSSLRFGSTSPSIQDYIQTDASINPGNSGGPLANIRGEVIGINSAISSPSGVNVGIGFAIPIGLAREILDDLKEHGEVRRAFLGVHIQEVDANLAEALGLDGPQGVLVSGLLNDGPAAEAGILDGDVIIEFNGRPVESIPKLQRMVGSSEVGTNAKVVVIRDGERKRFKVELALMNNVVETESESAGSDGDPWMGLEIVSLDSPEAKTANIDATRGVMIVSVEPGSPAARAELRPGYVIQKLGVFEISGPRDFREARGELAKDAGDRAIAVYVRLPGGGQRYFALAPR